MKGTVAAMIEPMKMEYQEYDIPYPERGAVILKVTRTNVCGSELHIWRGHHPTKKQGVLGHEMVGRILRIGEGVETDYAGQLIKEGDRVAAVYYQTCRKCEACLRGEFPLCENAYYFWNKSPVDKPHFHGSFATHYYVHPNQYFYKVPDNVPDIVAASANCALSQVYYGLSKAQLTYGETVVIQGAGGLGLNAAAVAKEHGATVIIIDSVETRLKHAKDFGADYTINLNEYNTVEKRAEYIRSLTHGKGADVGLEVSGVPDAFSEGIHLIRPGGRYVSIGNVSPGQITAFDPGLLTRKSIMILPVVRYEPWYLHKALNFLSKTIDKYPFEKMIDAEFEFGNIQDALDKSASRQVTRASIVMS
ncbi:threonine dehydrogenase-like Zn-dependent dehydrogenase [Caldalkalibacillus uzonensis]|uniref:Threonine dehydrogenase-like Zn-dependent dehydrogenase n=1 Tax=Caldalkalibacillus uzonensis TaxID=353224 RepID=A0ABU0CNZ6_9BACI|nr:zinc-binding dehydrogenase [Caldalkalibacillus uzonensis]MDQ0338138.1 threonine dehydrogenase-like Zn-dependent dehydrogenase [Caldalkalibacillus uzonensis]